MILNLLQGFLVGCIPAATMIIASTAFQRINVYKETEARIQILCAGLIIGVVACELYPLLILLMFKTNHPLMCIGCGFVLGMVMIFGNERAVLLIDSSANSSLVALNTIIVTCAESKKRSSMTHQYEAVDDADSNNSQSPLDVDCNHEALQHAHSAMTTGSHRAIVLAQFDKVIHSIHVVEQKASLLGRQGEVTNHPESTIQSCVRNSELIGDEIDEEVHRLQYNIDHCRRHVLTSCYSSDLSARL